MLLPIIACALAIVVPLAGVAASLIYVQSVRLRLEAMLSERLSVTSATLTTSCAQLSERIASLERGLQATTGTHLAGELAALAGDVEALSKTVRKNFGRVWAELHHDGALRRNNASQSTIPTDDVDEDLAATLALQGAPTARPNGG